MTKENSTKNSSTTATLNGLRAAVLGANDGIVSTSSVVMGVAGATSNSHAIFTAGMAALVAGALSMAVGEYVSVSSQSDAEKAYIENEKLKLKNNPDEELEELTQAYVERGVSKETATKVAQELTDKDALKAHLQIEFQLDEDDLNSPSQAAIASLLSFTVGGLIPFLAVIFSPEPIRLYVTFIAVVFALILTGYLSAKVGNASKKRAVLRVVAGGIIAMLVTYFVGSLFGAQIA
jgi:VIT1/CCC1 family predicted Fe2+/Mn2+ transporter